MLYCLSFLLFPPFHILLSRRDSRSVMLHNKTALPVSWKLQGVEELGDEFYVPQDQGIIAPNSSWPLSLHFKARRPLNVKKTVRLEVEEIYSLTSHMLKFIRNGAWTRSN